MAAAFPPKYMAAVMFGNGVSGFGSIILRSCTLRIWPAESKSEAGEDSEYDPYSCTIAGIS